jgi:hypothetical protein
MAALLCIRRGDHCIAPASGAGVPASKHSQHGMCSTALPYRCVPNRLLHESNRYVCRVWLTRNPHRCHTALTAAVTASWLLALAWHALLHCLSGTVPRSLAMHAATTWSSAARLAAQHDRLLPAAPLQRSTTHKHTCVSSFIHAIIIMLSFA